MARSSQIIDILKLELRARGINYRDLAKELSLSESTIKHMFSSKNFSLKRLDKICEFLNLEIGDLVEKHDSQALKMERLSIEDEKRLITDIPLLLVAYCVTNRWSYDEILEIYKLEETEIIRCLAALDKMKMIELLPENKFRLLVSNNFNWHRNGPIEQFFRREVQEDFFASSFASDCALHMVKIGDLTEKSIAQVIQRLNSVGDLYEELSIEDRSQAFDRRFGSSMVVGIRKWEFDAFSKYLR